MKLLRSQSAFSLVELSIVLVILGLLTGGILGGQALIRAAELRAVSTEYNRWVTATQTFRDKYFALPGDMSNGTQFWGRMNSNADCVTNSSASVVSTGVCDGNANGLMEGPAAASQSAERFQYWRELAITGLIEGTYNGLAGSAGTAHSTGGVNVPISKLSNALWFTFNQPNFAGNTNMFAYDYGNYLVVGATLANNWPFGAAFRAEEAWNIDTKMDDGLPVRGRVVALESNTFTGTSRCTTATSNTDNTGAYNLSNSALACALFFAKAF
jgi:prepilin-type N-terminal cleavage/methylation domain-containing protein